MDSNREFVVVRPNYAVELLSFLKSDTVYNDFTIHCADKERVRCHGCVMKSQFDISGSSISTNLPKNIVLEVVDFCYSGQLRVTPENVIHLLEAVSVLKCNAELQGKIEDFFVDSVSIVMNQGSLIERLPEQVLRRTILQAKSAEIWMRLLFLWWSSDSKKRRKAYVEMIQELSVLEKVKNDSDDGQKL